MSMRWRALVIGAGLRRNKYGNLPRGAVKRVVAKSNTFVAMSSADHDVIRDLKKAKDAKKN